MEEKFRMLLMQKSNYERLMIGFSMLSSGKKFVEESIIWKNPDITPKELKNQVFLRFYKHDLSEKLINQVLRDDVDHF